jgi:hypothetical protein
MELFLCLDDLPFCVNRVTGVAAPEGVEATDRKTAFYPRPGASTHE